jgi:hypothetical protein
MPLVGVWLIISLQATLRAAFRDPVNSNSPSSAKPETLKEKKKKAAAARKAANPPKPPKERMLCPCGYEA